VRSEHAAFDGRFFEKHRECWPIAMAARTFADRTAWPDVEEYNALFPDGSTHPVRFVSAPIKRRRPPGPVVRADLYDAMIAVRGVVPTRAGMWHDYLNALVWASFPRAKLALHRRQHAAIERWLPPGATQLPNARTPELDTLALLDEGGVIVLDDGSRQVEAAIADEPSWIFFGHALFEGLVFGRPAMISRAVVLDARDRPRSLASADQLLAAALEDGARVASPLELVRLPLRPSSYFSQEYR
jgi:hypothetical protein